ncbi:MAG: ABC transporter ATP-binding protein, partial [Bacilli bacterium]|nr:ABC transporter ATP-binding protein [Bacilli bacterium]
MLKLKNIKKEYNTGTEKVKALKGINLEFRDCEFVSILGPSGCGKTTLLNIIGGLDNYTTGDLIISGKSTKDFKDRDWDTYRNHRVGFVFQSYNLIPHQTVFSNVELALTLSGIPKNERKKRVKEALKQVGLADQANKKPNQMSGGQMQRVAIARALVNDPEILLADEPTGALDSKTSEQIMNLLKNISKDRLIIMVTHNADLAQEYSSRIITLKDGTIIDDSRPFDGKKEKDEVVEKKDKKTSMSFLTALSLSLNNLLTKKGRTILTAFAGSIGIIGIALILSLSNGVQEYINGIEKETLSSYPLIIQDNAIAMDDFLSMMMPSKDEDNKHDDGKIYSNNVMSGMLNTMTAKTNSNNLKLFKEHIESSKEFDSYTSAIGYGYNLTLQLYKNSATDVLQVNPSTVLDSLGMGSGDMSSLFMSTNVFEELFNNQELNESMYDLVAGSWPKKYNEIVLVVDENNEIIDYTLYTLGLKNPDDLKNMYRKIMNGEEFVAEDTSYTVE